MGKAKNRNKNKVVKIGDFTVDSGQVLIGDPCYNVDYQSCCAVNLKKGGGEIQPYNHTLCTVVTLPTPGDGIFRVYKVMDKAGYLKKLEIYFYDDPYATESDQSALPSN